MGDSEGHCGRFVRRTPAGDNRDRLVCEDCGYVAYENPKIVVGAVATWKDRFLLCRRAIEPRRGQWTIPAGFLELGEGSEDGARREAWEEARARLRLTGLLAVYSIPRISQVQLIYRALVEGGRFGVGEESLEVALFGWDEIPWDSLAFPSVNWALRQHRRVGSRDPFPAFGNPPSGPDGGP